MSNSISLPQSAAFMDSRIVELLRNACSKGENVDLELAANIMHRATNLARGGAVTAETVEAAIRIFPNERRVPTWSYRS